MLRKSDRRYDPLELQDDDAAGLVAARLRRSGYPFLRSIKCEVCDGRVGSSHFSFEAVSTGPGISHARRSRD